MKLYYVTLNTSEEARQIGLALLEKKLPYVLTGFPLPVLTAGKEK